MSEPIDYRGSGSLSAPTTWRWVRPHTKDGVDGLLTTIHENGVTVDLWVPVLPNEDAMSFR